MPKKKPDELEKILNEVAILLNTEPVALMRMIENSKFPGPEDQLIDIRQLCKWLGISRRVVQKWMAEKDFPKPLILSRSSHHVYVRRWIYTEIRDWLHGLPREQKGDSNAPDLPV